MFKKIMLGLVVLLAVAVGGLYVIMPPVNIPLAMLFGGGEADETEIGQRIHAPDGFRVTLFATDLPGARFMAVTETGDVLVTLRRLGEVRLLQKDGDGDGKSEGSVTLLTGLNGPHGIDLHDGWLYIGEVDAIGRVRFDAPAQQIQGAYEKIITGLPDAGNHTSKTLRVGADDKLYVTIGSSCNVCEEEDPRRATMMRSNLDGTEVETYATGLRNSVGFDWSPRDGYIYATDNGRDLLGDDYPPCELNRVELGGNYGWPFVNGFGDEDPDLGQSIVLSDLNAIDPVHGFRAHNAPLGMTFLRHRQYPREYHNDALVALHGSWNRSEKDGYKVVRLHWSEDGSIEETDFMTGFLEDGDVIGRPVDVIESQDGSIYITDDFTGSIYRLAYQEAGASDLAITRNEQISSTIVAVSDEVRQEGRRLYTEGNCVTCHGSPGDQDVEVPLGDLAARFDQQALISLLQNPPASMPKPALNETQLNALSGYLLAGAE